MIITIMGWKGVSNDTAYWERRTFICEERDDTYYNLKEITSNRLVHWLRGVKVDKLFTVSSMWKIYEAVQYQASYIPKDILISVNSTREAKIRFPY